MSTVGNWRGSDIVKDGLVFYLDAGSPNSYFNKSNAIINDISGNGTNGTLTNGPTFNTGNGGSIVFDGTNDTIVMPTTVVNSTFPGLTVECWVYPTNASLAMIMENGTSYNTNAFYIAQENATQFSFEIASSAVAYDAVLSSISYSINTWYHLVGTWTPGSNVNMYMNSTLRNGTRVTTGVQTVLLNGDTNLYIGVRPPLSLPYRGNIGITRIYNKALSATEVLQNYNTTKGRFGL